MLGQILVRRMSTASYVCKELSIPVPWGSIAAKQWTNVNKNKSDSQGEPKSKGMYKIKLSYKISPFFHFIVWILQLSYQPDFSISSI